MLRSREKAQVSRNVLFFFFLSFFELHQSTNSSLELPLMTTPVLFPVSLWNIPESSNHLEKQRGTFHSLELDAEERSSSSLAVLGVIPHGAGVWHGGELSLLRAAQNESLRDFPLNSDSPALPSPLSTPTFLDTCYRLFWQQGAWQLFELWEHLLR